MTRHVSYACDCSCGKTTDRPIRINGHLGVIRPDCDVRDVRICDNDGDPLDFFSAACAQKWFADQLAHALNGHETKKPEAK